MSAAAGFKTPTKAEISVRASTSGLAPMHTTKLRAPLNIVKTDIPLPWMPRGTVAFTLDNVFTKDECAKFIELTEATGYGTALVNVGHGRQMLMTDVRNNTRCMIDDPVIGNLIYERIQKYLPQVWHDKYRGVHAKLCGLNERLRFLKYVKSQHFAPHNDGTYERSKKTRSSDLAPELSYITVQLYLSGGDANLGGCGHFTGGSTAFIDHTKDWERRNSQDEMVHCTPRTGRVLVFQHRILHQGSAVTAGTKYCLRTDAMYLPTSLTGEEGVSDDDGLPVEAPIDAPDGAAQIQPESDEMMADAASPGGPTIPASAAASSSSSASSTPCRYAKACTNLECRFAHPEGRDLLCRYGSKCAKQTTSCPYGHPQ